MGFSEMLPFHDFRPGEVYTSLPIINGVGCNCYKEVYNTSYLCIRPFVVVMTPCIIGRGPPCGIHLLFTLITKLSRKILLFISCKAHTKAHFSYCRARAIPQGIICRHVWPAICFATLQLSTKIWSRTVTRARY